MKKYIFSGTTRITIKHGLQMITPSLSCMVIHHTISKRNSIFLKMVLFGTIAHGVVNANSESNQTVKYGWSVTTTDPPMVHAVGKLETEMDPVSVVNLEKKYRFSGTM